MKIDKPENSNYAATVISIKNIIPLENCDNVVATTIFGFQAIVGKDTQVGDLGIVFPAETQLSDEYCYNNNLYRHGDKNIDESQKGYLEDNRRIRAIRFRGNASSCLFMPLSSLKWTKANVDILQEGDEFDTLNGKEICKKYVLYSHARNSGKKSEEEKFVRVDTKNMPEHFSTDNYFKWGDTISPDAELIVTQKIHGTSIRIGNTVIRRRIGIIGKILSKLRVRLQTTEYDYVYGSRKVIKDINNPYQNHFYDKDIWTEEGKKLQGILPKNYIVYAELIGWTGDKEIQRNYTYGIEKGKAELYVYRIAIVNEDGYVTDLSWNMIQEFCKSVGLKTVPEITRRKKKDFDVNAYTDIRYFEAGYRNCLSLGENKNIVDEGVCIRVEGLTPKIFKAKSPKFLEHETALLDKGEEDLESSQN